MNVIVSLFVAAVAGFLYYACPALAFGYLVYVVVIGVLDITQKLKAKS
jgi:hypothetical protein